MEENDWDWDLVWRMSEMDDVKGALSKWAKVVAKALLDLNERIKKLEEK